MNLEIWTAALLDAARHEFTALIAGMPAGERKRVGALHRWSPKDELAHVVYWLELYAAQLRARRAGLEPKDLSDYQPLNDAAWHERRDWAWAQVESAWQQALVAVATELDGFGEAEQRPLMRSLVYELVDHPYHHYVRLYQRFGQGEQGLAMLARAQSLLQQRGTAKWTATARRKLKRWALGLAA